MNDNLQFFKEERKNKESAVCCLNTCMPLLGMDWG